MPFCHDFLMKVLLERMEKLRQGITKTLVNNNVLQYRLNAIGV